MERWLLISNCQTAGLATSIQLLNRGLSVLAVDIWHYLADQPKWDAMIQDCTRVVLAPEVEHMIEGRLPDVPLLTRLPALTFSAYHPDLCYIDGQSGTVVGPLGNYHSMIAFSGYKSGLSANDTISLFNAKIYEQCGYFDYWGLEKQRIIALFKHHGIDIESSFVHWGRHGSFMHSSDHPKIQTIYEIARCFLISQNIEIQVSEFRPIDGLVNGPCWPVYPELGEFLGVEGSYNFKRNLVFNQISLAEFVSESYATYEQLDPAFLVPMNSYQALHEHVSGLI
jgi:hypothetical protein